jgi:maleylacetoacetate isomerase
MHLKLYYATGANCCDRVRWALDFKRLSYELVDLDGPFDQEHFTRISPFGRVPILEVDGVSLTESQAMLEFLEEIAPSPSLNYVDYFARAQVREVCEAINSSIHPVQNSGVVKYFQPDWTKDDVKQARANWIATNLNKLQPRLWLKSRFAVGDRFTLADILVSVIFNKCLELGIDATTLPQFQEHLVYLLSHAAIRNSCPLPQALARRRK